jgi:hypothetical protein
MVYDEKSCNLITLCSFCHIAEHAAIDALKGIDIREMLMSGMLAIDIYKKIKSKEIITT